MDGTLVKTARDDVDGQAQNLDGKGQAQKGRSGRAEQVAAHGCLVMRSGCMCFPTHRRAHNPEKMHHYLLGDSH